MFYPEDDRFLNRRDENISLTRSSDPTGRRELGIDRTNLYREIVPCEAPSHARRLVPIGRIGISPHHGHHGVLLLQGLPPGRTRDPVGIERYDWVEIV